MTISKQDLLDARKRIEPYVHNTPVLTCSTINRMSGAQLFFKCENFQKAGAFKTRGATNAALLLSDELRKKGIATHSSGNHAQAVALTAKRLGIHAYIVMPENSTAVKVKGVQEYGGQIHFCKPTLQAREETLAEVVQKTGATFIPPYNHENIIAGQSTAAQELFDENSNLDMLITPVGGGGLLSGSALAAKYFSPYTKVYGAEPKNADDAWRSIRAHSIQPSNNPQTICDGLLTSLGEKTFAIIHEHVADILLVTEQEIIDAMRLIWERMKIIVEPSSAVSLGTVLKNKELFQNKRVGLILSGGNVDLGKLPWIAQT